MYIQKHLVMIATLFAWLFSYEPVKAQSSEILETYIKKGLGNNLALRQKELNLEKSLKALSEAKGLFYPSVTFEAQYFLSKGGRSIDFPIGDLLNPVYSSLNEILTDMGQPGAFPQLENQEIQFLPNNYHDTKLRVIMPLVNSEIYFNRKIRKELMNVAQAELNVYRRELVKEIKIAYYRYLQSNDVVNAYNSALELVNEAYRVNSKLVENQMAGPEKLYRIEAEQSEVKAQLAKAINDRQTAGAFFNFLINEPLNNRVETDSSLANMIQIMVYDTAFFSYSNREEVGQLNSAVRSADLVFRMKKASKLPVISNITDIGYQGYYYKFNHDQQYIMNTVNFSWQIFGGFQNRNKTAQAHIDMQMLEKKRDETELQLELQSSIAYGNLKASLLAEEASQRSLISSREYYKVVSRQYQTGQKSLLDLLDARNQLTTAQISYHSSHFESLIRLAEQERVNASINLDLYK